jgi:acid-activated urea channel
MYIFLPVALVFVGFALIVNGSLFLSKSDSKSIGTMYGVVGFILVMGALIGLGRGGALMDYQLCTGFFLFGFTYVLLSLTNFLGLDLRLYGWYALLVAVFAIIFGTISLTSGFPWTASLWYMWAFLWGYGWVETVLKKSFGAWSTPVFCIILGLASAFIPGVLMFAGVWPEM